MTETVKGDLVANHQYEISLNDEGGIIKMVNNNLEAAANDEGKKETCRIFFKNDGFIYHKETINANDLG